MRGSVLGVVVAAVAATSAMSATTAHAVVTGSSITQPASGHIVIGAPNSTGTLAVSGTTTGSGNVDILCYYGSHPASDVPVPFGSNANVAVPGGPFTATLNAADGGIPAGDCTLRAVPAGTRPTNLSPFTGPQVTVDFREPYTVTGGPNNGTLNDYFFSDQQSQGYDDFFSVSSCGLCDSRLLIDPTNFYNSRYLFFGNGVLQADEFAASNDRANAQIDGHNVLFSHSAQNVNANGAGFPALTMSSSFPPNGDMTIVEDEDAVRCPTDAIPYSCPMFLPTGLHLHRTIFQTLGGTLIQIVDAWSSTDNAAHDANFDYDQFFEYSSGGGGNPPAYKPSYEFPWGSPTYSTFALGDTIPAPPAAPVSMFVKGNSTAADGDTYYPQGSITVDPAPSGIRFYNPTSPSGTDFALNFTHQIPAGGTWTIKQTFSIGSTQAGVAALAAQAEDQQDVPVVAISAPANRATVTTPTVTVTGTATDRNITALSVNGQPTAVGAGGAFSARVSLNPGSNTLTATATDGAGNQGSASASVSYQPPAPSPKLSLVGAATPSSSGVSFSAACQAAAGTACNAFANMTTLERLLAGKVIALNARKKRSSKRVVVGSKSFSLAAGKTATIVVPLNSAGRKLLARFKRLPATLTITLLNTTPQTVLTTKTTIKSKKKKKKRRR